MRVSGRFLQLLSGIGLAILHMQANAQASALPLQMSFSLQSQGVIEARPNKEGDTLAHMLSAIQDCADMPQGLLRLDVVLSRVICSRLGVREGTGLSQQAQSALEQSQLQNRPNFSLTAGIDNQRATGTSLSLAARMDWVLFDFGGKDAAVVQARQAMAAVLDDQRAEVLLAIADAAQLYAAAKSGFGRFDVAATNLRVADASFQMANARYQAGASTLSDKLQAQTALAQARLEHARARSQWYSASGSLAIAMGLPAQHTFEFEAVERELDAQSPAAVDAAVLMVEARERHPQISAARSRLAQAQSRIKALDSEKWGAIRLNAVAGTGKSGVSRALTDASSAALFWTLPLFTGELMDVRQRDAAGQIQVRSAALDEALKQVELQIWLQSQALNADRDILRESKDVLAYSDTFLRASTERYRQGVGSMSEVLNAQNIAANARFQWVESKANMLKSQLKLAASVGRLGPLQAN
jgi:outer membrane protein